MPNSVLACSHPISINVLRNDIIFLAVMYNAAISASAADAIIFLMICAIVKTGPLSFGFGVPPEGFPHQPLGGDH